MRELGLIAEFMAVMWAHPCGTAISARLPRNYRLAQALLGAKGVLQLDWVPTGVNESRIEDSTHSYAWLQTASVQVCTGMVK